MNTSTLIRWMAVPAAAAGLLAGCSSSAKKATAPAVTTTVTVAATTTSAAAEVTTTTVNPRKITISPKTGLKDAQVVHVVATGFSPNQSLGVNECADKGNNTGAGDCNLGKLVATKSDASGTVTTDFTVYKGPFGANAIVCSAQQACLVSVSQLIAAPTEEVDDHIEFAA